MGENEREAFRWRGERNKNGVLRRLSRASGRENSAAAFAPRFLPAPTMLLRHSSSRWHSPARPLAAAPAAAYPRGPTPPFDTPADTVLAALVACRKGDADG